MLLGQIHRVPHDDFFVIPLQCPEQTPIPVHHHKPKPVLSRQQPTQVLSVEFAVTELNGNIDRSLRFEVNDHLLLALFSHDHAHLEHEAVFGTTGVQFESLLRRHDRVQHRLPRALGLDVRCNPVFLCQFYNSVTYLLFGRNDYRHN